MDRRPTAGSALARMRNVMRVWCVWLVMVGTAGLPAAAFAQSAPVAGPVSIKVFQDSTDMQVLPALSGDPASVVTISAPPLHGSATATGLSMAYTPSPGYIGPDSFMYTASNADGMSAPAVVTVTVIAPVTIMPAMLRDGTVGTAYSVTLTASGGGGGPFSYSLGGDVPPGFVLNSMTGALSGTPTVGGTYTFTATAVDMSPSAGGTGSRSYTVTIAGPTVPDAPTGAVAVAGDGSASVSFAAPINDGGSPISSYVVVANPGGAMGSASTSPVVVSGLVNGDDYTFRVQAINGVGRSSLSVASNSVTPKGAQTITFNNPGNVNFGSSPQLTATSSEGLSVRFSSGTLPVCTVTPTGLLRALAPGTCTITASQDGDTATSPATPVTQSFPIVVPGGSVSFITSSTLANAVAGTAYNQVIMATGGAAPYQFSITGGSLPNGLSLSSTGVLSGTPTMAVPVTVTITVTDMASQQAIKTFSFNVAAPTITFTPSSLPPGKVGVAYSTATVTATGGSGTYQYTASGNVPPGLVLSQAGVWAGTPTTAGRFNFTITATDTFNFSGSMSYTIDVDDAVPVALSDSASTNANSAVTIAVTQNDSGPITRVDLVQAPTHGTATVNGLDVIYTPASNYFGSDVLTYIATGPGGTSAPATVNITVNPGAVPVAPAQSVSVVEGQSVTVDAKAGASNGPFVSAAVVTPPASGSVQVRGTDIIYTAQAGASGTVGFDYTLSNPFGVSQPAHVTITINALPVASAQNITVLAGQAVTIDAAAGARNGPITRVAVTNAPDSGSVDIQGTHIVYTAAADASGILGLDYTVSNAFGTSQPARITLQVHPLPVAQHLNTTLVAGLSAQVDLTAGASGGPFTAARVVSIAPANAGTAVIRSNGGSHMLVFTAAAGFSGTAQLNYTLSNAFAESAMGTVSVAVTPRSDPSKDAEVTGILNAQAEAARRLAYGQISNFQRRLETLHGRGDSSGFTNNLSFTSGNGRQQRLHANDPFDSEWSRRYLVLPEAQDVPASRGNDRKLPGDIAVWTGGAVNFGTQRGASSNGIDFTTAGISVGADKRFGSNVAIGVGLGYGHDASDIGKHHSRSTSTSYNVAMYASYTPSAATYLDALVGYQWLSYDARRYVTDNNNTVRGSRDGDQAFASLSFGYEHRRDGWLLAPYGRLDIADGTLDAYTERGDSVYAIHYREQSVKTFTGSAGLRAEYQVKKDSGTLMPRARVEYQRDFQGANQATMSYADLLAGPVYRSTLNQQSRNHMVLGLGLQWQSLGGWMIRAEYQNMLDNNSSNNQSVLLGVEKAFKP